MVRWMAERNARGLICTIIVIPVHYWVDGRIECAVNAVQHLFKNQTLDSTLRQCVRATAAGGFRTIRVMCLSP